MSITWPQFNSSTVVTALGTDIIVGLRGTTCFQFHAASWLLAANDLSDVGSASTAFGNISPLTTNGDMLIFNTTNVRLGIGSSAQIMGISAGLPAWINNPGLLIANNLSDLNNVPDALVNLGLDPTANVTFNSIVSTTSITGATIVGSTSISSLSFISTGLDKASATNAITAHTGGGQGSAVALTATINRVTTVAAGGDSVKLPAALAGRAITVINAAASNPMDCFPASGDAINALSANTALSIVANKTAIFFCAVNGTWNSVVTA